MDIWVAFNDQKCCKKNLCRSSFTCVSNSVEFSCQRLWFVLNCDRSCQLSSKHIVQKIHPHQYRFALDFWVFANPMGGTQWFIVALIFISLIISGTEYLSLNIWESVCSVNSLSVLMISLLYCSLIFFLWLVKMLYTLKKFVLGWWGIENISLGWFYLLNFVLPCRVFF